MTRATPHEHRCAGTGCGRTWTCANPACTDLPAQTCGCGAPLPQPVEWTRGLEDAGHALDEAAFAFRRRGRMEEALACQRVRGALIAQAERVARDHGLAVR